MRRETLNINYDADVPIAAYRIVKHADADGEVVQAAAATDSLMGVSGDIGSVLIAPSYY